MSEWIFFPLAALSVVTALAVVLNTNPVRSALGLVATLFLLAVFYAALEAHLVAALHIIVSAGAVMVLFLFVITLLNLQSDPRDGGRALSTTLAVVSALVVGGSLAAALSGASFGGEVAVLPEGFGTTAELARRLFLQDVVAFEITSILLLVAVIGAVVLAKRDIVTDGDDAGRAG